MIDVGQLLSICSLKNVNQKFEKFTLCREKLSFREIESPFYFSTLGSFLYDIRGLRIHMSSRGVVFFLDITRNQLIQNKERREKKEKER